MCLESDFKVYTGFKPPRFKQVLPSFTRQEKIKAYNANSTKVTEWKRKKFVKYSPHKIKYEFVYNMKALYISPEDDLMFRRLHPQDYEKYAPSVDDTLPKGMCKVDEANFFTQKTLADRTSLFDAEMDLIYAEEDKWDFIQ